MIKPFACRTHGRGCAFASSTGIPRLSILSASPQTAPDACYLHPGTIPYGGGPSSPKSVPKSEDITMVTTLLSPHAEFLFRGGGELPRFATLILEQSSLNLWFPMSLSNTAASPPMANSWLARFTTPSSSGPSTTSSGRSTTDLSSSMATLDTSLPSPPSHFPPPSSYRP